MATVREVADGFIATIPPGEESDATRKYYFHQLKLFCDDLGSREAAEITEQDILDYLQRHSTNSRTGKPIAPDTYRARTCSIDKWHKFGLKRGYIPKEIYEKLDKPVGRKRERIPHPDEVERIKSHCKPAFLLAWAFLRMSGCRPGELARSRVENWDKTIRAIVLQRHKTAKKTGRARKIPVGASLAAIIDQSLNGRTEGYLFVNARGEPWTTNSLGSAFRRARDLAGVTKEVVNYSARHAWGTWAYHNLGIIETAESMGHKGTNMVMQYAHMRIEELASRQDLCPL